MLRRGGARDPELHPFYPFLNYFVLGLFLPISPLPFFAHPLPPPLLPGPMACQDPTPTPNAAQPLSAAPNSLFHPYLGCR